MSSLPKHEKFPSGDSPGAKPRGNRLARRARSFKEDFLGILSQMRSPGGSGTHAGSRAQSPSSPRLPGDKSPSAELDVNVRQAQLALKHFRDVIAKNKLEMLPGNGTVVLETVTAIHVLLKRFLANEQSSTLVSATNQMYQSLAKLIKLCDDYLLIGEQILGRENVAEVLQMVEDAIQNFVSLSKNKLAQNNGLSKARASLSLETSPAQRSSLPDIPLTPRERQLLEQTAASAIDRHSHSTENILRDAPPPKPPHPDRLVGLPPPLPPKKKPKQLSDMREVKSSLENMSIRSKSPADSSSLFSESAGSLDSVLNHSREYELRSMLDGGINANFLNGSSQSCYFWDSSSSTSNEMKTIEHSSVVENGVSRLSGSHAESGFASYQSSSALSQQRSSSSSQQFSTRSSQLSRISHESHYSEKNTTNVQGQSSSQDGMLVSNGVSLVSAQHSSFHAYSARIASDDCSSCAEPWSAGDVISYCPAHRPDRIENPLDEGWSLFSSPSLEDDSPPALPEKLRPKTRRERHPSQYDNVPDGAVVHTMVTQHATSSRTETRTVGDQVDCTSQASEAHACTVSTQLGGVASSVTSEDLKSMVVHTKTADGKTEESMLCTEFSSLDSAYAASADGNPPPLPMKKKHIMAYMEMFGNASHNNDFLRHTVHVYHQTSPSLSPGNHSLSSLRSPAHQSLDPRVLRPGLPPALPPKRSRISSTRSSTASPPPTPTHTSLPPDPLSIEVSCESPVPTQPSPTVSSASTGGDASHSHILDLLDVTPYLVMKKPEEEGPDIRGGHPHALIAYATKAHKNDFLYQEAFLTTYRTFLSPLKLTEILIARYERFIASQDSARQRAAREAFSLLVRVVNDLTLSDVENVMLQTLMDFVQCLLARGDLTMAKALRVVMLNKYNSKKIQTAYNNQLPSYQISIRATNFLDLKSEQVAEQMTLLDAELFLKIEIPEVLIWAQEQNEERSPNLTKFTEHFNKMSYWARSRILGQMDSKEREKYIMKFIKIMKHLRKINNFNSYLALLSALDSAPIRRLEWPKHVTEGLKEYCALIDSSSSFRAYRQALADTQPPCIPYIGLVLQDLTFVHIGNNNLLPDESINFSKRWQQFNIVENMKKFKKGSYKEYQKNERIIGFFNDFDDSLSEEAMWQISEKIKPRPGKKT